MQSTMIANNLILSFILILLLAGGSIGTSEGGAGEQAANQPPELVVQTGHSGLITSIAFTLDSKLIASGSYDNTIKIWDAASGVQIRTLAGHTKQVTSVVFSPDGKYLASGSFDYTARIWDVATGKLLHTLARHSLAVQSVAINRDGTLLATSSIDKLIVLWDLASGKELRTLMGHTGVVTSVAFGPDGKTLVSASWDKTVKLWDTTDGSLLQSFAGGIALLSVAFSPQGRTVASAGSFGTIKTWDVASGRELHTMSAGGEWVYPLAFSPDGKYLASGTNDPAGHTVRMWDVTTGSEADSLKSFNRQSHTWALAFSPDGKTLAVGGDDNSVALVDLALATTRLTLTGHSAALNAIAFSPDGKGLAVAANGPNIKLWDLRAESSPKSLVGHTGFVSAVAFSPDNEQLASGSYDKTIRIWNLVSGKSRALVHAAFVNCVAFSPDGKLLASGGDDSAIKLWNVENGALLYTLSGHLDSVHMIAFAPGGKTIASASADATIKLWDVVSGHELRTLNGHSNWVQSVAFSSDGRTLASGSVDQSIKLWDVDTGMEIRTLNGHSSVVQSVAFSADGKRLASGSWDRTVKIWDAASGKELQTLTGHADQVASVSFYRGGKILASASLDAQTKLWDVASGAALASLTALDQNDWAVVASDGRFDASADGMKLMHYVQGNRPIALDAFFDQFDTPHLLAQVMSGDTARAKAPAVNFSEAIQRPAPLVRIISPKAGEAFSEDSVRIELEVADQGGGVDEIRLFQNGKVLSDNTRGLGIAYGNSRKFNVTLLSGVNTFRATAFNKDRTESSPVEIKIELRAAQAVSDLYVLAVGLDKYKNTTYNLNFGRADAQAFADAVEHHGHSIFRRINKQVILDEQATRAGVQDAFDRIIAKVRPQDAFVFFFAGHGVMSEGDDQRPSQFYLVPYDVVRLYGNDGALATNGMPAQMIKDLCAKVQAQKQLIVLDACQSGGAVEMMAQRGSAEEKAIVQLARSAGITVLASAGEDQVATEFAQLGHGVFTFALLEGLSGKADGSPKDGKITVKELDAYISDQVPELTKTYHGRRQEPRGANRGQDFPLGVVALR